MMPTSESDTKEEPDLITTFNQEVCSVADDLNKDKKIHAAYGFVDGFNLSYSTLKYFFDLKHSEENQIASSDDLHDFMGTPLGAFIAITTTTALIAASYIGNTLDKNKQKNDYERMIELYLPYLRDALKTTKNALKGVRSTIFALTILMEQNYKYLIFPLSLLLGLPSLFNRLYIRSTDNALVSEIKQGSRLLKQVMEWGTIYHLNTEPDLKNEKFWNTYVFVDNVTTQELVYINSQGQRDEAYVIKLTAEKASRIRSSLSFQRSKDAQALAVEGFNAEQIKHRLQHKGLKLGLLELKTFVPFTSIEKQINAVTTNINLYYEKSTQSFEQKLKRNISKAYNGFIDGLYLFMGAMTLISVSYQVLIALTVISSMFVLANITNRLYEEYAMQQELVTAHKKLKHVVSLFELEQSLNTACEFSDASDPRINNYFKLKMDEKRQAFLKCRLELKNQYEVPRSVAFFMGLQRGLMAYSALTSLMFCIAFLYFVGGYVIPLTLVLGTVLLGTLLLGGFIVASLSTVYQKIEPNENDEAAKGISGMVDRIKNALEQELSLVNLSLKKEIKEKFYDGMIIDPAPQFFFQETFETLRSIFASFSKGQKEIEFLLNAFQQKDQDGHYRDSKFMVWLMVPVGFFLSFAFGQRTFAKQFSNKAAINPEAPHKKRTSFVEPMSVEQNPVTTPPSSSALPLPTVTTVVKKFRTAFFGVYNELDVSNTLAPVSPGIGLTCS